MTSDTVARYGKGLRFLFVSVALGFAWWIALLVPGGTRSFLVTPSTELVDAPQTYDLASVVWGLLRVITVVSAACYTFRWWRRRVEESLLRLALAALGCLWAGCCLFLLSTGKADAPMLIIGPLVFIIFASYVALPMTLATAWLVVLVDEAPPALTRNLS